MAIFDWTKIKFSERRLVAQRADLDNPIGVAARSWDQLAPFERSKINNWMINRRLRGQRFPGEIRVPKKKGKGMVSELIADTVAVMRRKSYSWDDRAAIRMVSNDIFDVYMRNNRYRESDLNRFNQGAFIRKVMKKLNPKKYKKWAYTDGGVKYMKKNREG
ncbi:MAG: hypothetical protein DRN81_04210 [Thermoproteota archaeon]|nr:MAG: hypothetical protein DRN81_04210 [Candidatus Korarchaeota archaeon]